MELSETDSNPLIGQCAGSENASLLLGKDSFEVGEKLHYYVERNASVSVFLRAKSIIWNSEGDSIIVRVIQAIWNVLVRCGLLCSIWSLMASTTL